jgi:uncharacterized protein DUF1206
MAIATAMRVGGGLIDQAGTTHVIYQQPLGAFFLILAAIGWLGYALWCLINTVLDTDDRGTDLKGSVARLGYGAVGVTYAVLGYVALGLATGKSSGGQSSNKQAQDGTAHLLSAPAGAALVVLVGLVVLGIAGTLFYRAYTAEFRQQLELGQATSEVKMGVILLGRVGNAALGIIFTIIGLFFIIAAFRHDPQQAKGLSGALGALLEQPFGNFLLAIVALGLLAYGFFSLAQAKYRRIRPV